MEERRSRSIPSLLNISTGACECVNKPSSWTRLNWNHRLLQKKIQPQFKPSVVSDPSDAMLWPPFFSHHRHHRNRCSMLPTLIPTLQTKKPKIRWWRTPTCRRRSKTDSEGLRTTRQTSTSARVSAMVTSWGDPTSKGLLRALVVVVADSQYFSTEFSFSPLCPFPFNQGGGVPWYHI